MNSFKHSATSAIGFGLVSLILVGAVLLQELDQLVLNWTYVLALIVTTVGSIVVITGLVGTYRARGFSHMAGLRPSSHPKKLEMK